MSLQNAIARSRREFSQFKYIMITANYSIDDFPALQMVRTGRYVRNVGRITLWILVLSAVAMVFVPWRQTARGTGVVVALDPQQRPQPMLSQAKGIISYVKPGLREGSYVKEGELLLRMTPFAADGVSQLESQILALESKETALQASMAVAEQNKAFQLSGGQSMKNSLDQDLEAAKQKWEQAKNEVTALQADLASKENQLQVAERVFPQGLVSQEELIDKRQAVQAQLAKVLQAENKVQEVYATLASKEEEIEAKKQEISIKNQEAADKVFDATSKLNTLEKDILDLRNKRSELDRLEIRAPRSGYIQQWYGRAGSDTIKEGEQLFVIVPIADQLAVELKVSGNDMPLIKEGDPVRMQFEGWPAVQFVGWPSVAVGTFGGKVNRVFPTDDGKGNFRVIVVADNHFEREDGWPDSRYLRQGVRANGWILLRRVSLGYEVWRQLNGFPPVVANDEPKDSKGSKVKLPKP